MTTVAESVRDVVLSVTKNPDPLLVNFVHPRPVSWKTVFQAISDALPQKLPLVPFSDWLAKVDEAAKDATASDIDKIVRFPSAHVRTSI